ncbi:hypothetical protein [Sorangium sp. So ce1151]|uniref:hypothetical protein n=1 Tax=Sorangium sp. So ce1151 TaxID=3133332 RepID=UPI003F6415C1
MKPFLHSLTMSAFALLGLACGAVDGDAQPDDENTNTSNDALSWTAPRVTWERHANAWAADKLAGCSSNRIYALNTDKTLWVSRDLGWSWSYVGSLPDAEDIFCDAGNLFAQLKNQMGGNTVSRTVKYYGLPNEGSSLAGTTWFTTSDASPFLFANSPNGIMKDRVVSGVDELSASHARNDLGVCGLASGTHLLDMETGTTCYPSGLSGPGVCDIDSYVETNLFAVVAPTFGGDTGVRLSWYSGFGGSGCNTLVALTPTSGSPVPARVTAFGATASHQLAVLDANKDVWVGTIAPN